MIAGTTASGKSGLALRIALRTGGVIINGDSVQLYQSLPILTAQPTAATHAAAPHRLYGLLGDLERCSVARWLELAAAEIRAVQPRLAIVTGGTGFYLEALVRGLSAVPPTPPALRAATQARFEQLGRDGFEAALAARDPVIAADLPADPQRLMRAWEVFALTGRSLRSFAEADRWRPPLPAFRGGVALVPAPACTARRIERRLDSMIDQGALEELDAWRRGADWRHSPLAKADGVRELGAYLDGDLSLLAAREATVVKVRRYAKRQRTWLRHRLSELSVEAIGGEALAASWSLDSDGG